MKVVLGALLLLYLAICGVAFLMQRALIYPAPPFVGPIAANVGETLHLRSGSHRAFALYVAARAGSPTLVHFHGNARQLSDQQDLAEHCRRIGIGLLAVEYPGYGPAAADAISEAAIYRAAELALRHLRDELQVPSREIVLQGRSLGTGVAIEMASRGHGARVVLISPYTSMVDMARSQFPWLPVSLLVRDRFDSLAKASRVKQPTLIVHGVDDALIPLAMGQRLADALPNARLLPVADADHNDLLERGGPELSRTVDDFIVGDRE